MWNETVLVQFEVLFRVYPEGFEKNHEDVKEKSNLYMYVYTCNTIQFGGCILIQLETIYAELYLK